ncbi:DUF305 domain-containing protein [Nocardioides insulae]|uniref:DUF305 domain-containing protein n=1 Tax=Nocardioides insulae TaxID=394734 RepID=UPI0004199ED6|nr:DUF305 domain-containing protein [Nocardioides insulae]
MLTRPRNLAAQALALAALTVLSGCTSDGGDEPEDRAPVVQLGGPGESNSELSEDEIDAIEAPAYTDADVGFVQNMIPHHQQALTMIDLVAARTDTTDLPKLTERMAISQLDEIAQLERWLTERGEELPGVHHEHGSGHDMQMPGMLTDAELSQLSAARGARFDRLFLQYMIRHHEGAVIMVQDLLNGEGGQEPAIFQLAQHIESDQTIEISRMKHLLIEQ